MSKGTVISNPVLSHPGKIKVTEADINEYGVKIGAELYFNFPPPVPLPDDFPTKVNDTVKIRITSIQSCEFISVLEPAR